MSDFYQHGMITTLQKLRERPAGELNEELMAIARRRKIVLLLPALISEFDTPSMPVILEELKKVTFLHKIVLSLDRADEADFQRVRRLLSELPTEVRIVWHDGPRMQDLYDELRGSDFNLDTPGKGRSVCSLMPRAGRCR